MKVSIITVCYNSSATIENTLQSVISQDYQDIEYIVIDGASDDGTVEIIKNYEHKISTFISEKDKGIYDAINKGINLATGEVVGLLHSDDFYSNEHVVSTIASGFTKGVEAVYSDLQYVHQNTPNKVFRNWKAGKYEQGIFKKGWMPPHPTLYIKRSVYQQLGLYNLDFKFAADYELMLRFVHKHQIKLNYIPQVLIKMRVGGESNASFLNRIKANNEDVRAWHVNELKPGPFFRILKPLSKLGQFI